MFGMVKERVSALGVSCAAVATVLWFTPALSSGSVQAVDRTVRGTVVATNLTESPHTVVVQVILPDKRELIVGANVASDTRITRGRKPVGLENFKIGEVADLTYCRTQEGLTAQAIHVRWPAGQRLSSFTGGIPMHVDEIMNCDVECCGPETNLAAAATMMWDGDYGALPVVHADRQVIGMVTDRDIAMAAATKHRPISAITVRETITGKVYSSHQFDDVHRVLERMAREKIHRVPVVDEQGRLQGIVAMNDFIRAAEEGVGTQVPVLSYEDVTRTLKAISAHRMLGGI